MKRNVLMIACLLGLLAGTTAGAQSLTVTLRTSNFISPLVKKWVAEYQKIDDSTRFQIVSGKGQADDNTISFVTADGLSGDNTVFFGRYAVLPVTVKASEADRLLGSRRLNAKKLKNLFFFQEDLDEAPKETAGESRLHIYTGNSPLSASRTYAAHFKQESASFKGKKISGDDTFLNTAISRDPLGVTVNSLSNIFDLQSRQLQSNLAIVPLDVKQARQVLESGRLDDLISLLEEQHFDEIPVSKVGVDYDHTNSRLNNFVRWILQHGVQYVHEYGLLELPQKELTSQQRRVERKDLAQK